MSDGVVIKVATGRRATDGHLQLSVFAGDLLALIVEDHGERAPALLLTREQARELHSALAELIPLLEESRPHAEPSAGESSHEGRPLGVERRRRQAG